jgi:WD40 repeat protein
MAGVLGNESTPDQEQGERAVGGPTSASASRRIEALLGARRHALVIGIDAYAPEIGELTGAAGDARAVAAVLGDASRRDCFDNVTLLVDHEATREGIARAFATLKAQLDASSGARVVIYFAGHGVATALPEETETDTPGYLLPCDARREDVASFVSMRALRDWVDALACHHLRLILDCCFAGACRWAGTRAARATPRQLYRERLERYLRDPAWQVLTSAAHDERALDVMQTRMRLGGRAPRVEVDPSGARSPFAVALVECLRGDADFASARTKRPDGVITSGELHTYLEQRFSAWEGVGPRVQKPLLFPWPGRRHNKGEFVFLNPREALRLESAGELLEANNPYRGLRPFRYDALDAGLFFGRDALVARLVELVMREPVVVVLGASGTGKSSLVAAGLLPKLAAARWVPACDPVRPGSDAREALRRLACALDPEAEGGSLVETARRFFARDRDARRVIVVDQLEELVTLRQGPDLRAEFFAALDGAVEAAEGRLRVVSTLRSDFEPHFAEGLIAKHATGRFRVTPLSRDELREVIEKPAEACVLGFDPPELVDAILDEVMDAPGALPLLSFTLSEMYLQYVRAYRAGSRDDRALTLEDYVCLGRVEGALSRRAEEVYARFDASACATMRRVMLRMLSVEGGQPTRRPVRLDELTYGPEEDARVRSVLGELTEARLVVGAVDEHGAEVVELAHDKIALGWPRLTAWIHEPGERERLDALRIVRERAEDWRRLGRAAGWLDRDTRLDRWIELAAGDESPFNAEELTLLRGSLQRRDEEREAEKRRIAALEDALRRSRDHARMSVAREFANDPTTRIALLREVERPERALRWGDAAREVLLCPDVALAVFEHEGAVASAVFSMDGASVVTASADKVARVWRGNGVGEPVVLRGHEDRVCFATFSMDGARVATASIDKTARVWRADGQGEPVVLRGHGDTVYFARFSPDGARVVTASKDQTARVWRADGTGEPVVLTHEGMVFSVAFSADGERVVTASDDKTARVWRSDGAGEPVVLRGHEDTVFFARFSPDGARVVTASDDKTARVWRSDGAGEPVVLWGHEDCVRSARFSPDGAFVVTASLDRTARVWRSDGASEPVVLRGHDHGVQTAGFSSDGTRVVTASLDKTARVWRANGTGEPVVLRGHEIGVLSAEFSSDGTRVVTASGDTTARLWRVDATCEPVVLGRHEDAVYSAAFSSDGTRVVTASKNEAHLWRADGTGESVVLRGHEDGVFCAVLSKDGTRVVTASMDGTARVWSADGKGEPVVLRGHEDVVLRAVFSSDGTRVVTVSKDKTARVWRADGQGEPVVLQGHESTVRFARFSPDGARVVTASEDRTARVWRADGTGESVVLRGHEDEVWVAAFSADGSRVVTASYDKTARLWSSEGRGEPVVLRGHEDKVDFAAFSSDGTRVVTASYDTTARVWRADGTGESVVLRGHDYWVQTAEFSSDGTRVVTASMDGTARVWRADGAGEPVVLRGHKGWVRSAAFSSDGTRVVTASMDNTARVWRWARWSSLADMLWGVTPYCLSIKKRMELLGETEEEATRADQAAREKIAALAARDGSTPG